MWSMQAVDLTALITLQLGRLGLVFSEEKHSYQASEIGDSLDRSVFAPALQAQHFSNLKTF